jgi:hypothetical protein
MHVCALDLLAFVKHVSHAHRHIVRVQLTRALCHACGCVKMHPTRALRRQNRAADARVAAAASQAHWLTASTSAWCMATHLPCALAWVCVTGICWQPSHSPSASCHTRCERRSVVLVMLYVLYQWPQKNMKTRACDLLMVLMVLMVALLDNCTECMGMHQSPCSGHT